MHPDSSHLDNTNMVSSCHGNVDRQSIYYSERAESVDSTWNTESSSSGQKIISDGLSAIRQNLQNRNISTRSSRIIMASWRPGTQRQYNVYIRKWFSYCHKKQISSVQVPINCVLDFLAELYEQGLKYTAINSARSALSALGIVIDGFAVGSHPLVIRFLKGVYNLRTPVSRYCEVWDVNKVLDYLKTLSPLNELNLKQLTLKLVMLIALTTASRSQSLHLLTTVNMVKEPSKYILYYSGPLKQSRPGYKTPVAELCSYSLDKRLCVYSAVTEYLKRTQTIRGESNCFFISYVKPFGSVTSSTISRWIRSVMASAGIDCEKYKAHSVRCASSSKALSCNVPIDNILKVAGWTNAQTFAQYYHKKLDDSSVTFTRAILTE